MPGFKVTRAGPLSLAPQKLSNIITSRKREKKN